MEYVQDVQFLKYESVRLDTFHCWSITCPIRPKELSRQGFYFSGENDAVTCIFCKGQLNTWMAGDVVSIEHSKWYPNCPFVEGKECGNVPMLDINVKYAPYIMFYDRMESFRSWHTAKNLTPDRMASAGFFQINPFDHVKCFSCGVRLNKWLPDNDPWEEHRKFSPDCPFVRERYGCYLGPDVMEQLTAFESLRINPRDIPVSVPQQETGYDVLPERNNFVDPQRNSDSDLLHTFAATASRSAPNFSSPSKTGIGKEFLENLDELGPEELKQIILEQEDERLCKICFERKQKVIFQPCNHMVCCAECGEQQRLCPICRRRIDKVNVIFFS